jgi:CTP-dependent riboflavin kinase
MQKNSTKETIEKDFDELVEKIKRSGKKASKWLSEQKFEDQKKFLKMLWSRGNLFKLFRKVMALKRID